MNTKCSSYTTFVDISVLCANLCRKFYTTVKQENICFITKFGWNILENDKIMPFQPRQPSFLSVWASCRTGWKWTSSLRRTTGPKLSTSGAPCWKRTINSSWSLRQLMSWKSPCRPSGKSWHSNTSIRCGELHQVLDCLHGCAVACGCQWWSLRADAVTLSIFKSASSSHRQQTGSFESHQQTTGEESAQNAEKWGSWLK